jgi:hypothetical protein
VAPWKVAADPPTTMLKSKLPLGPARLPVIMVKLKSKYLYLLHVAKNLSSSFTASNKTPPFLLFPTLLYTIGAILSEEFQK